MVNNTVFEYFRKNRDKYPIEALKQKALAAGYSPQDVDDAAIMSAKTEDKAPKKQEPVQAKVVPITTTTHTKKFSWMTTAGIIGLLFFTLYLGLITAGVYFEVDLVQTFNIWWALGLSTLSILYLIGFIKLAKHTESKTLTWTTYTRIGLALLAVGIYAMTRPTLLQNSTNFGSITTGILFAYILIWIITKTMFATGLIKIGNEIRFIKVVGILNIIYLSLITLGFLYILYLFFKEGTLNLSIGALTILYWDFVIIEIFNISALFFEAITLFFAHKKYE